MNLSRNNTEKTSNNRNKSSNNRKKYNRTKKYLSKNTTKNKYKTTRNIRQKKTIKYGGMEARHICYKCNGTGRGEIAEVDGGLGYSEFGKTHKCRICNGSGIVHIDVTDRQPPYSHMINTGNNTSGPSGIKRGMSLSVEQQTIGNCWAHAISKILGFWESLISRDGKRITEHQQLLDALHKSGRYLGTVFQGGGIRTGDLNALLDTLNVYGIYWNGKQIDEPDVKNLLNKYPIYMEVRTDVHTSKGEPLWNGNHAVIAINISPDGKTIIFWNSHGGDGIETKQLDKSIYHYLERGEVNFYLLWPEDFVNKPMKYYIELDRIKYIRHLLH